MMRINKIISIGLTVLMAVTSVPISTFIENNSYIAHAAGEFDGNNSGGGESTSTGASGGGLTWSAMQQGYRFTIVL